MTTLCHLFHQNASDPCDKKIFFSDQDPLVLRKFVDRASQSSPREEIVGPGHKGSSTGD